VPHRSTHRGAGRGAPDPQCAVSSTCEHASVARLSDDDGVGSQDERA
jgi:hypothetical protein